jgi:hypothetical protein
MNEPLRGCPLCGTPVEDVKLGMRDFRWVSSALPGRVAPMDLDAMLEKNGHHLVMEMKPGNAGLPLGQRITLKTLVVLGMDVWVIWEKEEGWVEVGSMDKHGEVNFVERMSVAKLRSRVAQWYEEASREG